MSIVAPASTEIFVNRLVTGQVEPNPIDLSHAVGGLVFAPVGLVATAVTFTVAATPGADPTPVLPAANNTAVSLTVAAGQWAVLPADLFGFYAAALKVGAGEAADRLFQYALVRRFCAWRPFTISVASGASNSAPQPGGAAFGGNIVIPAVVSGTVLNWQVSGDSIAWTTVLAQTIAANGVYPIPLAAARAPLFRVNMGSTQGAALNIAGVLKLLG